MLFGMFCVIVLLHVYCRSIKTSIFHFHDEKFIICEETDVVKEKIL